MRLRYKVKDANDMTIGAATSHEGAVAVAQQVQGAAYIYDAKTERSFSFVCSPAGVSHLRQAISYPTYCGNASTLRGR
jgi:hypothetical protein